MIIPFLSQNGLLKDLKYVRFFETMFAILSKLVENH